MQSNMVGGIVEANVPDIVITIFAREFEHRGLIDGQRDGPLMTRVRLTGMNQLGVQALVDLSHEIFSFFYHRGTEVNYLSCHSGMRPGVQGAPAASIDLSRFFTSTSAICLSFASSAANSFATIL